MFYGCKHTHTHTHTRAHTHGALSQFLIWFHDAGGFSLLLELLLTVEVQERTPSLPSSIAAKLPGRRRPIVRGTELRALLQCIHRVGAHNPMCREAFAASHGTSHVVTLMNSAGANVRGCLVGGWVCVCVCVCVYFIFLFFS